MKPELQAMLRKAYYAWLTTVRQDGMPQPTPVWFIWNETTNTMLVLSLPGAQKIKNIQQNSRVALSWSDEKANQYVVVMGTAQLDQLTEDEKVAYVTKYATGIAEIGYTPDSMLAAFTAVIRITPEHSRGEQ